MAMKVRALEDGGVNLRLVMDPETGKQAVYPDIYPDYTERQTRHPMAGKPHPFAGQPVREAVWVKKGQEFTWPDSDVPVPYWIEVVSRGPGRPRKAKKEAVAAGS